MFVKSRPIPPINPYKTDEFRRARELRTQGWSLKRIAAELDVSPSTARLWTYDIRLTAEQRAALRTNSRFGYASSSRKRFQARLSAQRRGRWIAQANFGIDLYLAGCMLYWAEGSKSRNSVAFVNSDVAMLRFFRRFLVEGCGVAPERIRLSVNCFLGNGLTLDEIQDYWLEQIDLPRACLRKAVVNSPSRASKGKRRPLLYGTARLTVHSTDLVQEIFGAIQQYGAFDQPQWARSPTQAA